jgi:hypothetical protein
VATSARRGRRLHHLGQRRCAGQVAGNQVQHHALAQFAEAALEIPIAAAVQGRDHRAHLLCRERVVDRRVRSQPGLGGEEAAGVMAQIRGAVDEVAGRGKFRRRVVRHPGSG